MTACSPPITSHGVVRSLSIEAPSSTMQKRPGAFAQEPMPSADQAPGLPPVPEGSGLCGTGMSRAIDVRSASHQANAGHTDEFQQPCGLGGMLLKRSPYPSRLLTGEWKVASAMMLQLHPLIEQGRARPVPILRGPRPDLAYTIVASRVVYSARLPLRG